MEHGWESRGVKHAQGGEVKKSTSDAESGLRYSSTTSAKGYIIQHSKRRLSVTDAYVAVRNPKRRTNPTTFAFVRYLQRSEAVRAVELGHGRLMDGYRIRVYTAKENKPHNLSSRVAKINSSEVKFASKQHWKFVDNRTFKEILTGVSGEEKSKVSDVEQSEALDHMKYKKIIRVSISEGVEDACALRHQGIISIQKGETEWRKRCLVTQIKSMYNPELIEELFASEGIPVKVSPWYGLLAVLQFQSIQDMRSTWSKRDDMLRDWFDEMEMLVGFEGKRKVKRIAGKELEDRSN